MPPTACVTPGSAGATPQPSVNPLYGLNGGMPGFVNGSTIEQNFNFGMPTITPRQSPTANHFQWLSPANQFVDQANAASGTLIELQGSSYSVFFCSAQQYCLYSGDDDDSYCNSRHVDCMVCDMPCHG